MERIRLSREEKKVLRHIVGNGEKQPRDTTPIMFHYCLSTLQEKGLVKFRSNYDEILSAKITVKGAAYLEQNPELKNPIDWKWIIQTVLIAATAVATMLALFIACGRMN